MGWLILAAIGYFLYTRGVLSQIIPARPVPETTMEVPIAGGYSVRVPLPPGYRAYRLADGSQVLISPTAATAPGGWVQGMRNGIRVWFNEATGEIREYPPGGVVIGN